MGIKEDYIEKLKANYKTVYFHFPRKKFLVSNKLKFIIKPIVVADLLSKELLENALKEMSTGQSIEESSKITLDKFKKEFLSLDSNSGAKMLFDKGIVYPKIVNKKEDVKPDELPFDLLTTEIKVFLLQEIMKISPIFQGSK